jgi:hypothetical protein
MKMMNPNFQQVGGGNIQGLFSCWTLSDVLAGVIYRRIVDLKVEAVKNGTTTGTDLNLIIPAHELQYYAQNAVLGVNYLEQAYFSAQGFTESAGVSQTGGTQQRRTA